MVQQIENSLILEDKRKRLNIVVDGENVATAIYNPEDPRTYKGLLNIISLCNGKKVDTSEVELTDEELEVLEKEAKTSSDFENSEKVYSKLNNALQATIKDFDDLEKGVDSIFGEGICGLLLKYGSGGEYLAKLISIAFSESKETRKKVKNKYKAIKENDVIE